MKERNKTFMIAALVLSVLVLTVYGYVRAGQIHAVRVHISQLRAEERSMPVHGEERGILGRKLPEKTGTADFVDHLYEAARRAGIGKLEVSTLGTGDTPAGQRSKPGHTPPSGGALKSTSLKISFEGKYRETAEYIREVQNIEQHKRIMEIRMQPAKELVKTDMTIQTVSREGRNAAQ